MNKIILPSGQEQQIFAHCERAFPHECCGVLAGKLKGDASIRRGGLSASTRRVTEAHPLTNLREKENAERLIETAKDESAANRYLIDPAEQMRVERDLTKRGLDVVGFYHSHPNATARPSKYDLENAWPIYIYVIVSVRGGKAAEMTAWLLRDDRSAFDEVAISLQK